MDTIEKLQEKRQIKLAKEILENAGYRAVSIKEANEGDRIKVILNNNSKAPDITEFDKIMDNLDQYDLYPLNDGTPCPWDADISFEGDNIVLSGGVSTGRVGGGTWTVKIPINRFSQYFYLEFQLAKDMDVEDFFDRYNWDYTIL